VRFAEIYEVLRDVEQTALPAPSAPGCPALPKAGSSMHHTPFVFNRFCYLVQFWP
jgi:hypothetical protein